MIETELRVLAGIVISTLLGSGLIGLCCYVFYGLEIAIISVFSAVLCFTIIHIILFYVWLTRGKTKKLAEPRE